MNPFKAGEGLTPWLLRIALLVFVYHYLLGSILQGNFSHLSFYVNLAMAVFAVLLFVGGFFNNHKVSVFSGFIILLLALYKLFLVVAPSGGGAWTIYLFVLVTGYFFWTKGNKS